jgi:hypothetical protein
MCVCVCVAHLSRTGAALPRSPPQAATQAALSVLANNGVRIDDVSLAGVLVAVTRALTRPRTALLAGTDTRLALRLALRVWLRFVGVGAEGETRRTVLSWVQQVRVACACGTVDCRCAVDTRRATIDAGCAGARQSGCVVAAIGRRARQCAMRYARTVTS